MTAPSLFAPPEPLAARMRPRTLAECVGQEALLAEGRALGDAIRQGEVGSCIFWGPPGTGKTTIARLIARHTDREFVELSAVLEGVARVREIIHDAEQLVFGRTNAVVTFTNNLISALQGAPWTGPGGGNSALNPGFLRLPQLSETTNFTTWAGAQVLWQWFSLCPGSPAQGAGPNGRDLGAVRRFSKVF